MVSLREESVNPATDGGGFFVFPVGRRGYFRSCTGCRDRPCAYRLLSRRQCGTKGALQAFRRVAALRHLDVKVAQQGTVVGVCDFLDDLVGALDGRFAPQVGHTVFGDDDLDGVFRMIQVRYHRHDGGDESAFGLRGGGEDGQVGVAGEVARSADTVHHLLAQDVGGVDVAEDVGFDGGVDGDEPQSAYDLGVVGEFLRTENYLVAEEVHVGVHFLHGLFAQGQGASAGKFATSFFHQADHGILDHFGVHLKGRYFLVFAQAAQYGIGDVAHTRLDGQER